MEPLLKRVEDAARNVIQAGELGPFKKGPVGMLSKMGGRLISFYADDIADLLLHDFLAETALELQTMEAKSQKDYSGNEAEIYAQSLLQNLAEYQSEEAFIQMRWNNPAIKGKKAGTV